MRTVAIACESMALLLPFFSSFDVLFAALHAIVLDKSKSLKKVSTFHKIAECICPDIIRKLRQQRKNTHSKNGIRTGEYSAVSSGWQLFIWPRVASQFALHSMHILSIASTNRK